MKKKVFKKLICTVLTAVCIVTSVVPTFAEDTVTTTEAATVKNITSVYKYHLDGYDKKGNIIETFFGNYAEAVDYFNSEESNPRVERFSKEV